MGGGQCSSALMTQQWTSHSEDVLVDLQVSSASTAQMTGVLLMAHGSPDNLDDMGTYSSMCAADVQHHRRWWMIFGGATS